MMKYDCFVQETYSAPLPSSFYTSPTFQSPAYFLPQYRFAKQLTEPRKQS